MARPRKPKRPTIFAGRLHDMRGPFNSILSVACEGPECEICAKEREKRATPDACHEEPADAH